MARFVGIASGDCTWPSIEEALEETPCSQVLDETLRAPPRHLPRPREPRCWRPCGASTIGRLRSRSAAAAPRSRPRLRTSRSTWRCWSASWTAKATRKSDWDAIWRTVGAVTAEEWDALRANLERTYRRIDGRLRAADAWEVEPHVYHHPAHHRPHRVSPGGDPAGAVRNRGVGAPAVDAQTFAHIAVATRS